MPFTFFEEQLQNKKSKQEFRTISSVSPEGEGCGGFEGESGVAAICGAFRVAERIDQLGGAADVVSESQLHFRGGAMSLSESENVSMAAVTAGLEACEGASFRLVADRIIIMKRYVPHVGSF